MPEPQITKIVIAPGPGGASAVFPQNTQVNVFDSVFWFNNTTGDHQPTYNGPNGPIAWGPPPNPLGPQQTSSQVNFSTAGKYSYYCSAHPTETGVITVNS
jgi:plastocyanin